MKFKKGDYVVGTTSCADNNNYASEFAVMEVLEVDESDGTVRVEILSHEFDDDALGEQEWVDEKDLVLKNTIGISNSLDSGVPPVAKIEYSGSKVALYKAKGLI